MEVLSSWWGGNKSTQDENQPEVLEKNEEGKETKGDTTADEIDDDREQKENVLPNINTENAVNAARDIGNYLYNFAKVGTQRVSETATKTASVIQKTVEERVTLVGEFQKEQNKFIQEKHSKRSEAAVPPWVGYNEEKQMKEQILALSQDKRNFLRNPPAGVQFHFDFSTSFPIAMATLQEDPNLQKMRFSLVPSKISEEHFWKNYFYRVSLIKQSSQLTSLAASSGSESKSEQTSRSGSDSESTKQDQEEKKIEDTNQTEEDIGGDLPVESPGEGEFISDDFQSELDKEEVLKGMEQLGMDAKEATEVNKDGRKHSSVATSEAGRARVEKQQAAMRKIYSSDPGEEEIPEWEKELQQELSDYEVVGDSAVGDEEWEQEINDMLEAEGAVDKS